MTTALSTFHWRAFIGFQLSWFALIGWQYIAMLPVVGYFIYAMFKLTSKARIAVGGILLLGVSVDVILLLTGVLQFGGSMLMPSWFVLLWAMFALASVEFMASVLTRPWVAAVLGGIGGPMSYWGGAKLSGGLLQFPLAEYSAIVLVVVWAAIAIALGQSRRFYAPAL
ncbi:DUF2878 domain-containing protein [Rheinheimera baltica]|uniref:DUF2878 domain-containing protein n=1 Tax=Rheinheimera baltica TaxID=67576 RepID=A0ABT9HYQ6_9GAMM|nr:DUF2878 domain-containing protein [Rheinheimera baltica]MDP5136272.1 DUF2878 domain-containing protein [Rheinheimera baltica]